MHEEIQFYETSTPTIIKIVRGLNLILSVACLIMGVYCLIRHYLDECEGSCCDTGHQGCEECKHQSSEESSDDWDAEFTKD